MLRFYVLVSIAIVFTACAAEDAGEGEGEAAGEGEGEAAGEGEGEGAPGARNLAAVGAWTFVETTTTCGNGFNQGAVGSALADDDQFLLVLNESFFNSYPETICTFSNDTDFTCTDISLSAGAIQACLYTGGLTGISGTIDDGNVTITGNFSSGAAGQNCAGGQQSCGPVSNPATGTITP